MEVDDNKKAVAKEEVESGVERGEGDGEEGEREGEGEGEREGKGKEGEEGGGGEEEEGEGEEDGWVKRLRKVVLVLGGEPTVALHQEFLIRNNHTDLQILKNTKVSHAFPNLSGGTKFKWGGG